MDQLPDQNYEGSPEVSNASCRYRNLEFRVSRLIPTAATRSSHLQRAVAPNTLISVFIFAIGSNSLQLQVIMNVKLKYLAQS